MYALISSILIAIYSGCFVLIKQHSSTYEGALHTQSSCLPTKKSINKSGSQTRAEFGARHEVVQPIKSANPNPAPTPMSYLECLYKKY